jgi:hypothetical protein
MTQNALENWALGIDISAVLISALILVVISLQLRLLKRQLDEHKEEIMKDIWRRRAEATTDAVLATLVSQTEDAHLPSDFDRDAIDEILNDMDHTSVIERKVRRYLGQFELLAAGVNADVYDPKILEHVAGPRVIAVSRNYSSYIDAVAPRQASRRYT